MHQAPFAVLAALSLSLPILAQAQQASARGVAPPPAVEIVCESDPLAGLNTAQLALARGRDPLRFVTGQVPEDLRNMGINLIRIYQEAIETSLNRRTTVGLVAFAPTTLVSYREAALTLGGMSIPYALRVRLGRIEARDEPTLRRFAARNTDVEVQGSVQVRGGQMCLLRDHGRAAPAVRDLVLVLDTQMDVTSFRARPAR